MAAQTAQHDSSTASSLNQNLGISKPTQDMDTGSRRERERDKYREAEAKRSRQSRDTKIEEEDAETVAW